MSEFWSVYEAGSDLIKFMSLEFISLCSWGTELTTLIGVTEELSLSMYCLSMLTWHNCFCFASPRSVNNVIYITNLFIYSVRAVISGLQWFSRNRQKSKYPISRHEFSFFCIFIITTFHFPLCWLKIGPSSLTSFRQSSLKSDIYWSKFRELSSFERNFSFKRFKGPRTVWLNTSSNGLKPRDYWTDSLTANNNRWMPSSQSFSVSKQYGLIIFFKVWRNLSRAPWLSGW